MGDAAGPVEEVDVGEPNVAAHRLLCGHMTSSIVRLMRMTGIDPRCGGTKSCHLLTGMTGG